MPGPLIPLRPSLLELLPAWMAQQRWYAGKGHLPALRRIGGVRLQDPAGEVEIDVHLLLDTSGSRPTVYQVPLTSRRTALAGGDHALVTTVKDSGQDSQGSQGRHGSHDTAGLTYVYDAPHDPVFAAALLRLMLDEQDLGDARGHRLDPADPGRLLGARVLTGEQSNTSIILDLAGASGEPSTPLICKLFRVLHHGQNPDVVVQSALAAAGSTRVPRSVGAVSGQWPDSGAPDGEAVGHLAFAQEFLPGVEDAWRVALAAVASGTDFSAQAASLGEATAQVHATLAQTLGTRAATQADVLVLTRSMRARHAAARAEVPALSAYDSMISELIESIDAIPRARWPALQRIHGDYHLGQVLDVPGRGWVLIDFEGEPLRPLAERTQPDLALRDVAGMLRSFDYAAGSCEQSQATRQAAQDGRTPSTAGDPQAWATKARAAFLEGYTRGAGRDPRADSGLLDALELDKALYEVVYEARNRPTWLNIPTTAIARLARVARPAGPAQPARPRSDLRS